MTNHHQNIHSEGYKPEYKSGMTRRDSLKLFGLLSAGTALTAGSKLSFAAGTAPQAGHWPELNLPPITAAGYGQDPKMIMPPKSPWPRTLTPAQLTLVASLADIVVPQEGSHPSASQVHVPEVVDEWVSAPYEWQQYDRKTILSILTWIDDEANLRHKKVFTALNASQQMALVKDIAYNTSTTKDEFKRAAEAFERFKSLVLAAYFCTPEGCKDIGYLGNVPIATDYPGPTAEAKAHLDSLLSELGLSDYAYQG